MGITPPATDPASSKIVRRVPAGPLWLIGASLFVIAACLVLDRGDSEALAQPLRQAGARGIFAFSGQLSNISFGVFMVDVDAMTIWCYEYNGTQLELVAARSWTYDRYLEQYNVGALTPDLVHDMVEKEREAKLRARGNP